MIGTPWFWRLYIGLLFVVAAVMTLTEYELPRIVRGPALSVLVGIQFVEAGRQWADKRGLHRKSMRGK